MHEAAALQREAEAVAEAKKLEAEARHREEKVRLLEGEANRKEEKVRRFEAQQPLVEVDHLVACVH
jgi:hypothetical protein